MPDKVMVTKAKLDSLAEAVGSKSGQGVPLTIEGMEDAVLGIETGIQPSGTLAISKNGTHDVTKYASARVNVVPKLQNLYIDPSPQTQIYDASQDGFDGYSSVVFSGAPLEDITIEPSTFGMEITPESGNYGIRTINVRPVNLQTKTETPGQYDKVVQPDASYMGLSRVNILGVLSTLQTKTVTPIIGGGAIAVGADSGYNGLRTVNVTPVPYSLDPNAFGLTASIG